MLGEMTRSRASMLAAIVFVLAGGLLLSGQSPIPPQFLWAAVGASGVTILLARFGT